MSRVTLVHNITSEKFKVSQYFVHFFFLVKKTPFTAAMELSYLLKCSSLKMNKLCFVFMTRLITVNGGHWP